MAFKMKGSPMARNYGIGSPTKKETNQPAASSTNDDPPAEEKSWMDRAYDKASQVGMGLKNVWDQGPARSSLGDGSRTTTFNPVEAYKRGRDREKESDDKE
tara:strand:- start:19 stop:321 length:303 start_codon:yes stop_codon:yes gene_type:complete